jgi:AraC-like DNA-binding protein/ligand-binding sensor protein
LKTQGQLVETLARSETFLNYERAYTEATGMPVALRSVESWQLPFHGKSRENVFCALMAGQSPTCAACLQLQEKLTQDAMTEPATRTCAYGLCETAVPVKLGPKTIGFLHTGQVMRQNPTATSFQRAVVQARKLGVDIANEQTRRAYFATPVVPQKKMQAVSDLLVIFADHLAMKSNQLVVQMANTEPPNITKAKLFIREHCTETLSLLQVSQAVHTSPFHFCKLFRKCTALSFTEFVSRTRVEKAKNLLLNPNLRISEIAYATGFQSLTHFARMFKRIVGKSSSSYRENLTGTVPVHVSAVQTCVPGLSPRRIQMG